MQIVTVILIALAYSAGGQIGYALVNGWFERRRAKREAEMINITPRRRD